VFKTYKASPCKPRLARLARLKIRSNQTPDFGIIDRCERITPLGCEAISGGVKVYPEFTEGLLHLEGRNPGRNP